MTLTIKEITQISRPRFWIYLFGPFLIGAVASISQLHDFSDWRLLLWGLYFLLPANLLVYGVNDIFDWETDSRNAKKTDYEKLLHPKNHKQLALHIFLLNIPVLALFFVTPKNAVIAFCAFLFFSVFYSAKPIRAKSIPFLDSAFNILYIFPGIIGFYLAGGSHINTEIILAGALWTAAMHAYSAVPDIAADKSVGVRTIATFAGFKRTLWICEVLYMSAAVITFSYLPRTAIVLGAVYSLMIAVSFSKTTNLELMKVYRFFPIVNAGCGMLVFFSIALKLI